MRLLLCTSLLVLGACSSPCEQLAKEICACEATTSARSACERRAAQVEGTRQVDDNLCSKLLDACDCHALETAQGKRNCGLAPPEEN
jgi:hypothetical protein